MIEILPGYPDDVLAISGAGRVTANDYRDVLIPRPRGASPGTARCASSTTSVRNMKVSTRGGLV